MDPTVSSAPAAALTQALVVADAATKDKIAKYKDVARDWGGVVQPVAVEVYGGIAKHGVDFLTTLTADSSLHSTPQEALQHAMDMISIALHSAQARSITRALMRFAVNPSVVPRARN